MIGFSNIFKQKILVQRSKNLMTCTRIWMILVVCGTNKRNRTSCSFKIIGCGKRRKNKLRKSGNKILLIWRRKLMSTKKGIIHKISSLRNLRILKSNCAKLKKNTIKKLMPLTGAREFLGHLQNAFHKSLTNHLDISQKSASQNKLGMSIQHQKTKGCLEWILCRSKNMERPFLIL